METFKSKIEFLELDICNLSDLKIAMNGVQFVFHQAAIPSVPKSIEDPIASHNADLTGTLHVLWAAKQAGVKRVIYAGSSSAYGDSQVLPKREDLPAKPISPYGLMKYRRRRVLSVVQLALWAGNCIPSLFQRIWSTAGSIFPVFWSLVTFHHRQC